MGIFFPNKQTKKSIKVVGLGIDEGIQDEAENLTQNLGMEICYKNSLSWLNFGCKYFEHVPHSYFFSFYFSDT